MSSSSTPYACYKNSTLKLSYTQAYTQTQSDLSTLASAFTSFSNADINRATTAFNGGNLAVQYQSYQSLLALFNTLPNPANNIPLCCGTTGTAIGLAGNGQVQCGCPNTSTGQAQGSYFDTTTGNLMCNVGYGCENYAGQRGTTNPTLTGYPDNRLVCACPTGFYWSSALSPPACVAFNPAVITSLSTDTTSLTQQASSILTSSSPISSNIILAPNPALLRGGRVAMNQRGGQSWGDWLARTLRMK